MLLKCIKDLKKQVPHLVEAKRPCNINHALLSHEYLLPFLGVGENTNDLPRSLKPHALSTTPFTKVSI